MIRQIIVRTLTIAGFISFFLHHPRIDFLLVAAAAAYVGVLATDIRRKEKRQPLFLPFASGIFCFVMRLFYWDAADFGQRIHHLIFLSIVSVIVMTAVRLNWKETFLNWFLSLRLKRRLMVIFLVCECLFVLASYVVVRKGVVLRGDEPHYLAVSHSLANDFDLNMFNQYFRNGYKEFLQVQELDAHHNFGRGYKKTYSMHLPGVAVTLVPFFFLKLPLPLFYFLVRAYLGLFGSLLGVVVYLFSRRIWKDPPLAVWITGMFTFTVPVFFYSIHVFPAVQALLLILSSLYFLIYPGTARYRRTLLAGLLLSVTVFWGVRYNLFIFAFTLGFSLYFLYRREFMRAVMFAVFPVLFQGLFFYYLYFAYGNFSVSSINYGMMDAAQKKAFMKNFFESVSLRSRMESILGMFWDQRDGLLLYNPVYFFFFPGFIIALKKMRKYWFPLLLSIPAIFYMLSLGFSTIRAGDCPQARYLVPVTGFLMFFVIVYLKESPNRLFRKILIWTPLYSMFVVFYQVFFPFTLYQSTTNRNLFRPGLMFQQWGSLHIPLPRFLPSFVKVENNHLYIPNIVIVLVFILLTVLALRGMRSLRLTKLLPVLFLAGFVMFSLFPRIPIYNTVLVENGEIMPYRIYGESDFPARRNDFSVLVTGKEKTVTFSTHRQISRLQIQVRNEQTCPSSVDISSFNRHIGELYLKKLGEKKMWIHDPPFRKQGPLYFYRLSLALDRITGAPRIRMWLKPENRQPRNVEKDQ